MQGSQMYVKQLNALTILFSKVRGVNPYRQSERLKLHAHIKAINYWGEERIIEFMQKDQFTQAKDWNLHFIPLDRLSHFISFIQSFGPSYEEVHSYLKENMQVDKKFHLAYKNGQLETIDKMHYNDPLYSDLVTKLGITSESAEYLRLHEIIKDTDKIFLWLQYTLQSIFPIFQSVS